jgi:hypothetical protein
VLQALAQVKIEIRSTDLDEPPAHGRLKPLTIPLSVPPSAVLAAGFDLAAITVKPRLLRYTIQPLRPKMALGSSTGPLGAGDNGARTGAGKKVQLDSPRNLPKSMLHLDQANSSDDGETVSLFGKIGGLFGKKNRNV